MSHPPFLSAASANALISDLRPTTLAPAALLHINLLLDEIVACLVALSESINPQDLRLKGIPALFISEKGAGDSTGLRAFGRSAIGEAELELRGWYDSHPGGREAGRTGFTPDNQGSGLKSPRSGRFPVAEATEILQFKCAEFSTLAAQSSVSAQEKQALARWKAVGGDCSEETLAPAGLWTTAILEHICEHVLAQLSRVVARDSSISIAGAEDLYVALCEDESIWGLFRRLKVKDTLEAAIRTGDRSKKNSLTRSITDGRLDTPSTPRIGSSSPTDSSPRSSPIVKGRSAASPNGSTSRNPLSSRPFATPPRKGHDRPGSLLSFNTRSVVHHLNNDSVDSIDHRRASVDEEEFDALVRSGETMKVSLTPSRLKTFDGVTRKTPASPDQGRSPRLTRLGQSPEVSEPSPLTPASTAMDASTSSGAQSLPTSRSFSGKRLVARSAAVIDEDTDEEETFEGRRAQKHSLADIFASEQAHARSDADQLQPQSVPIPRTVPAVILGAPPPRGNDLQQSLQLGEPIQPPPRSQSLSRNLAGNANATSEPYDDDDDDEASSAHPRPKARSEAQELADFLNNAPPPAPPPAARKSASQNFDEPPKSAKGFKSFVSRMTGRKKDKESSILSLPSSSTTSSINRLAEPATAVAKRQKSSPNFAFAQQDPNQSRSEGDRSGSLPPVPALPANVRAEKGVGGGVAGLVPDAGSSDYSRSQSSSLAGNAVASGRTEDSSATTGASQYLPGPLASDSTTTFATATEGPSPGSEDSFRFGNEGSTEEDAATELAHESRPAVTTISKSPHHAKDTAHSISTTDLAPLRGLLQHATSVRECQMLLSAALGQLGVPHSNGKDGNAQNVTPEARVTAWILTGLGPGSSPSPASNVDGDKSGSLQSQKHEKGLSSQGTRPEEEVDWNSKRDSQLGTDTETETETTSLTSYGVEDDDPSAHGQVQVRQATSGLRSGAVRMSAQGQA